MFDKSILETDNFLNISLGAKALYFLLGMEADDEGFISPMRVLRLYGGEKGDLKNLIDVGLVIPFKSGVVVITDWNQNNWLDNRRIRPTQYQLEKKSLILTEQKKYMLSNGLASAQLEESSIEEDRIEESRVEEIDMSASADAFNQFWKVYPKKELKKKTEKIWKSKKLDSFLQEILSFIEKAKNTDRWKKGYIKQPPTFLNGECWNDDISAYNDKFQNRPSNILPVKIGKYENFK